MAKREYPQDEFDNPKAGVPVGSHRRTPRGWTRAAAFLGTVALAAGAGYGAVWVLFNRADIPVVRDLLPAAAGPSTSAFVTITPSETPEPSESESPSPSPSETLDVRYGASVGVYNDSSVSGLAGTVRDVIASAEFTSVSIGNWGGTSPPGSVIRYSEPKFYDTAVFLGDLLGIGVISQGSTQGASIEIVLTEDPFPSPPPSPTASGSPTE